MNTRTLLFAIAFVFAWLACPLRATAHRLDEYLQATRLSIERDRIELEMDLTAGVNVSSQVFALIDTNHDGLISPAEGAAYAQLVLRSVAVSLDGHALPVSLLDSRFPEFEDVASGIGATRLRASASFPPVESGRHQIYYRNVHQLEIGAYLVNALVPTDKHIEIGEQRRDYMQHELTLDYQVISESKSNSIWWLLVGLAMAGVLVTTRLHLRNTDTGQVSAIDSRFDET